MQTLQEARTNARQAITQAEAWGLSPELSVGPVDVEEMSKPQKIMAQAHSYTLAYYDHLVPWKGRHEELWEDTIWEGMMPTGEFEKVETQSKHIGRKVETEPELAKRALALENVPAWSMRTVTLDNGDEPKRYKLYLPPGACHAIYHQLMNIQNQLKMAADVGAVVPEDPGVITHDDIDYSEFDP